MIKYNLPPFKPDTAVISLAINPYHLTVTLVKEEIEKSYNCPTRKSAIEFIKANDLTIEQVEFSYEISEATERRIRGEF